MARKNRIVMVRRDTPKLVRLPYGRTFYVQYKRATRENLPANVRLERVYRQRAAPRGQRRQQSRQAAVENKKGRELPIF